MRLRAAAALLAVLAHSGCAERDLWPVERLDPKTAVNVTLMAEPWVYAHDVPMLAANSRDYLNIGVIETNRSGTRAYWLGVIAWSTIDRNGLGTPTPLVKPGRVTFAWPGAALELQPAAGGLADVGTHGAIFAAPMSAHTDAWYPLNEAQLVQFAKAPPASASLLLDDGTPIQFLPWQVDVRSMEQFVEATGITIARP